jgi:hypothetical protein
VYRASFAVGVQSGLICAGLVTELEDSFHQRSYSNTCSGWPRKLSKGMPAMPRCIQIGAPA